MTTPRSNADVEQLLRRTYAEVADRTTVTPAVARDMAVLSPADAPSQVGRRRALAAVAVLALVVGGLFVLANRDAEQPAGRDVPTRVLPGWVPQLPPADGGVDRPLALTEVQSDSVRDRISYASQAGSISVELDRTRGVLPAGEPVTVRGEPGRRTDSTLSWVGPDGALVEVSWSGAVDETMVDAFVQAIAYVDDDTWIEAAGTGGFRRQPYEPLANVRIDADVSFDVELVGDLHEGLSLQIGPGGHRALGTGRCAASVNWETSDHESNVNGYVVLAPGDVAVAVVRAVGADDRRIDLTSLLPLADVAIGGVVYEERVPSDPLPRVSCEGAS